MTRVFYNLFIQVFGFAIRIHALLNSKSRAWLDGRSNWKSELSKLPSLDSEHVAWFHLASLGEFEQSLPIMERMKPDFKIVVTFFSPSGYDYRRNHQLPDHTLYLPLDTLENARIMVTAINPEVIVINKYDLWFNHLNEAKKLGAKLILGAANFRSNHHYFKWYGGFGRKMLHLFDRILVQNEASKSRLSSIGIESEISGDTRYDRVLNHAKVAQVPESIKTFVGDSLVVVFGSSWPISEQMLAGFLPNLPEDLKLILAPHDVSEDHIQSISRKFPEAIRFSNLTDQQNGHMLIIDNIGQLSSLYQLADVAYVGGAFESGLHNILEALAFGVPVVFGPNTDKFPEATEALDAGVATQISNRNELKAGLNYWLNKDRSSVRSEILRYMNDRTGATNISVKAIHETLGITQH